MYCQILNDSSRQTLVEIGRRKFTERSIRDVKEFCNQANHNFLFSFMFIGKLYNLLHSVSQKEVNSVFSVYNNI